MAANPRASDGPESTGSGPTPSGSAPVPPPAPSPSSPPSPPRNGSAAFPARPLLRFVAGPHRLLLGARTMVMGILNCTPDSFSDGGEWLDPDPERHEEAVARRLDEMAEEGADWIDVGGESTRPGAAPVDTEEEWRRVAPALRLAVHRHPRLLLSIDTTKPEVARRALAEGAVLINDVSGLRFAPDLADLAARAGAGLVLMHMRGEPRTMQAAPSYEDVAAEVARFLAGAAAEAARRGVPSERILLDPGIGFGKTVAQNLYLLNHLDALRALGYPLLVGPSRKSFIGYTLDLPPAERVEGTAATVAIAIARGAHIVRVHDVRAMARVARMTDAILQAAV